MISPSSTEFNEHDVLHELKHYLPAQSPLKDFIHHNTLHAFQHLKFHDAIRRASEILGYRVTLSLEEYRKLYAEGRIKDAILDRIIIEQKGKANHTTWKERLINGNFPPPPFPRIGSLRSNWKRYYQIDLDSLVHPILFRTLCSYLDQGISMWPFPLGDRSFLQAIMEMEQKSYSSFFKRPRARKLLMENPTIESLLKIVAGDEQVYKQYLFDQQFAHQGWAGMVSVVEDVPFTLLDQKKISLKELIIFELLLEIDALDLSFGGEWPPLGASMTNQPVGLFDEVPVTDRHETIRLWQEAFEWTYYNDVLAAVQKKTELPPVPKKTFQAIFCIDDRECSLRRYLEKTDVNCETYGTPGFFSVEFYFQPENGKFYSKLCPWPVNPKHLIKEVGGTAKQEKDITFSKTTHGLFRGWLISQTLGFWSALKLFINIFRPSMSPATASSFKHMDKNSRLTIENTNPADRENDLQIGFNVEEMANRAESLLKSIGLVKDFAPLVYLVGHGSSSVNNPHYAAYDCGACSGRAGSVNSRVMCHMLNHPQVREILAQRDVAIPSTTQFVGGLHDTTRDEIVFFDEHALTTENKTQHEANNKTFEVALDLNAKERSRRFVSVDTHLPATVVHEAIRLRSVSLFEPRPELNHATNALCIVGRRALTKRLFLDRRSFLNSYDYAIDPDGKLLTGIVRPLGPVCGGINLEYFFSRVDNQKLGAGTKLPHNVMGLFGVANGIDGDLRPGLPSQMIEVHDPVRLLIIIEHKPEIVFKTISAAPETYEWFINDWVHLVAIDPETHELFVFGDGKFTPYTVLDTTIEHPTDINHILEENQDNLPVYEIA